MEHTEELKVEPNGQYMVAIIALRKEQQCGTDYKNKVGTDYKNNVGTQS